MSEQNFLIDDQPLDPGRPDLGSVAVIPWDSEIFGFPVGVYRPGSLASVAAERGLSRRLTAWQSEHDVALISCRLKGMDTGMAAALARLRFVYVESSFAVNLPRFLQAKLPSSKLEVRLAEWREHDAILELTRHVTHGRYHADARFPRALAERRYRWWLEHALSEPTPNTRVYVMGDHPILGFCHVELDTSEADLRLCGLDRGAPPSGLFHLLTGVLAELAHSGVKQITARISATDTGGMGTFAALGFHFGEPQIVLHRHAQRVRYLLPLPDCHLSLPEDEAD